MFHSIQDTDRERRTLPWLINYHFSLFTVIFFKTKLGNKVSRLKWTTRCLRFYLFMVHSISTFSNSRRNFEHLKNVHFFIPHNFIPQQNSHCSNGDGRKIRLNINFNKQFAKQTSQENVRSDREKLSHISFFLCVLLVWKTVRPDYDKFRFKFILSLFPRTRTLCTMMARTERTQWWQWWILRGYQSQAQKFFFPFSGFWKLKILRRR